jgi:ankyrin repeat protein
VLFRSSTLFILLQSDNLTEFAPIIIRNNFYHYVFPRYANYLTSYPFLRSRCSISCAAAFLGSIDCLQFLCNNSSDLSVKDERDRSILSFALAGNHPEVIDVITNFGQFTTSLVNQLFVKTAEFDHFSLFTKVWSLYDDKQIETIDESGIQIIHYCVRNGNIQFFERALALGADINAETVSNRQTVLHIAAAHPNIEILSFVLKCQGINVGARTASGETAAMFAARLGYLEQIKLLCRDGRQPDLGAIDVTGSTALHIATINNRIEVVNFLCGESIESVNRVSFIGETPWIHAIELNLVELIEFYLNLEPVVLDVKKCEEYLGKVVLTGNVRVVKRLIEEFGVNVNEMGGEMTGLGFAVSLPLFKGEEIVRFLVEVPGRRLGKIVSLMPGRTGVLSREMKELLEEVAPDVVEGEV